MSAFDGQWQIMQFIACDRLYLIQRRELVLHKVALGARVPGMQLEEHFTLGLAGLRGGKDALGRQRQVRGVVQQGLREACLSVALMLLTQLLRKEATT